MADNAEAAALVRVLQNECQNIRAGMTEGFAELKADLAAFRAEAKADIRAINGTVRAHDKLLTQHAAHLETHCDAIKELQDWRTGFLRVAVQALLFGVGAMATAGGIFFGIGKAAGWW